TVGRPRFAIRASLYQKYEARGKFVSELQIRDTRLPATEGKGVRFERLRRSMKSRTGRRCDTLLIGGRQVFMKTMSNRLAVGFMLGFVSSFVLGLGPWISGLRAQSTAVYAHFYFEDGYCMPGDPLSKGAIDTRSGNIWCLPSNGGVPTYQGTLNLAGVPTSAPRRWGRAEG